MIRLSMVVALVACSSPSKPPEHPDPKPEIGSGSGSVAEADTPSEAECDTLLAHTLELAVAERPADQRISEAEQAKLRAEMRGEHMTKCRAMRRTKLACALDAPNLTAMKACDE